MGIRKSAAKRVVVYLLTERIYDEITNKRGGVVNLEYPKYTIGDVVIIRTGANENHTTHRIGVVRSAYRQDGGEWTYSVEANEGQLGTHRCTEEKILSIYRDHEWKPV